MIENIIRFSVGNKLIVGIFLAVLIGAGVYSLKEIPIDAVPDITNNQVQVVTVSPSLATQEIEQIITFPLETSLSNLPGIVELRSLSKYGLSIITVVFEEDIPILDARQYVREQLDIAAGNIPPELGSPELMPITTGLGEVYQYVLTVDPKYADRYDLADLRTIQDWIVKRQLAGIEGVVETSSFGGYLKQYEVSIHPDRMNAKNVSINELFNVLEKNNANSGGSYIEVNQSANYIRVEGLIETTADIENIVIRVDEGTPVLVRDVADVRIGHAPRFGALTMDGKGEAVGGITLMLKGENAYEVVQRIENRVEKIRTGLPEGIDIYPYLNRSDLVQKTINTASQNLIEGGVIVIIILILLLGNWRAGLIVASVIPLSMLFAITMMNYFGVSANLMSLGAIDFGIVVDGAVIVVENVLHVLFASYAGQKLAKTKMDDIVSKSAARIYKTAAFGILIILIVFVPILTLQGVEGKMFRPMAITVSFAILGAFILSLTYVPMMSAWFLSRNIENKTTFSDRIVNAIKKQYQPVLNFALRKYRLVMGLAVAGFAGALVLFMNMGSVFLPTLEEGDLAMQMSLPAGSSLSQSIKTSTEAERILLQNFPEIEHVVSKIGAPEIPTDPMSIEDADIMIILKEKSEWVSAESREELVEKMKETLHPISYASFEFTQPIQLRFNELMTGAKSDLAIQFYGEDLAVLAELGEQAAALFVDVPGAADVKVEKTEGLPQLRISVNRIKLSQYGLSVEDVNLAVNAAFAGATTGTVYEGERRFDLTIRLNPTDRKRADFDHIFLETASGKHVALTEVADISMAKGPVQISRENASRKLTVGVNVRNRDITSVTSDIESQLAQLELPPGYYYEIGGEFEKLNAASQRLSVAVPLALFIIFILLYLAFRNVKYAALIYTAIPLSAIGGVVLLYLRGMPFSISAAVGFIALFGVSVLNGIVLLASFLEIRDEGETQLDEIIRRGALNRMRPVLMTASVAALGFIPMAFSSSAGAEVQKPLATVVIGGLVTATFLTLVVLPAAFKWLEKRRGVKSTAGLTAIVLFLSSSAFGQTLDVDAAFELAKTNNPILQNAALKIEQAEHAKGEAWQIAPFSASYTRGEIDGPDNDYQWNLSQNFGSIPAHIQRQQGAQIQVQEEIARYQIAEKQLRMNIHSTWANWVYYTQMFELYNEQLELFNTYSTISKQRVAAGESDPIERSIAMNRVWQIEQRLGLLKGQMEQAKASLATAMGVEQFNYDAPEFTFELRDFRSSIDTSLVRDLELRKEYVAKMKSAEWSQLFPSISLGYMNQQLGLVQGFEAFTIGATIPLWFGPQKSRAQQLEIEQLMVENQAQQKTRELENQERALIEQAMYYSAILTDQNAVNRADEVVDLANRKLAAGEISQFDYIQSISTAYEIQLTQLEIIYQYQLTIAQLEYIQP